MRFLALAAFSRLRPETRYAIYPPAVLVPLASQVFSEYFDVATQGEVDIEIQHLGLRHILPGLLRGNSYYSPFYWILRSARTKTTLKDRLNDVALRIAIASTRLSIPNRLYTHEYQGFMEIQGLPPFRSVRLEQFKSALPAVLFDTKRKLQILFPPTKERNVDLVFPSSSAHTMMPPEFALKHFSQAQFAFHHKDRDADRFRSLGLSVVLFGNPPEDMFRLIARARRVYSTDSFSSHLAQTWRDNCFVLLTELKRDMTVVPGYPEAQIVRSLAPCHPCGHRARSSESSVCDAGLYYCCTWAVPEYLTRIDQVTSLDD